jgi:hypothetical protein
MDAAVQRASIAALLDTPSSDFKIVTAVYLELKAGFAAQPDSTSDWLLELLSRPHKNLYLIHYLQALTLEYVTARASSWTIRPRRLFGIRRPLLAFDSARLTDPLSELVEQHRDWYGPMPHIEMMEGSIHFLHGRLDASRVFFERAARLADEQDRHLQRMYLGAYSLTGIQENGPPSLEEAEFSIERQHHRAATVLIGTDMKYLRNYARRMAESIDALGVGAHFHVINPTDEVYELVPRSAGLSTECMDWQGPADVTWYTLLRFARARPIYDIYKTPLLILDIDGSCRVNSDFICKSTEAADVTFNAHTGPASHVPWRILRGSGTLVAPTSLGHSFLAHLERYVADRFSMGQPGRSWWFDQLAIFESAMLAQQDGAALTLFTRSPMTSDKSPDSRAFKKRNRNGRVS